VSLTRRDYLLRMIEQFTNAMSRITGARLDGDPDAALLLARETADGILGPLGPMLDRLDAASARALLGDDTRLRIYAALTAEQGRAHALKGEAARAQTELRRALELYLEALPPHGAIAEDVGRPITELRVEVDVAKLSPAYQRTLARV
jgi:hypothetical protein